MSAGYRIGIDTGGTFTDVVVAGPRGGLGVGKALSTPGRVEEGVFDGLTRASASLGMSRGDLLQAASVLAHGTTVGLNALLTGTGARVGLITTRGFESTLSIAKAGKVTGLPASELRVPTLWRKPDPLVRRGDIRGVTGRVDAAGDVLEPLDDEEVAAAVAELVADGVESLAVCLLWSTARPEHEDRVARIARRIAPQLPVSVSHEVAPRIGEYERMTTTVIDAYVAPLVSQYLGRLETGLRAEGFAGAFVIMSMGGGVQPAEVARRHPVHTLRSGPAGGVAASRRIAGSRHVIATDIGGTSFDVGLIIDGQPKIDGQPSIGRLPVVIQAVDIESIGTGGGSIAWVDDALGALRVGPETASSRPGPACYGFGGDRATLTDAAVVLGYIDRLGDALTLDRAAAWTAVEATVAKPLGLGVVAAADGIVAVAAAQMQDLIRRCTLQRGHDPSQFTLVAYGGAGPQFAGRFAAGLGVRAVVIPALAAGLSAFGALASDLRVRADCDLRPVPLADAAAVIGERLAELEHAASGQLAGAGAGNQLRVTSRVALRYYRQVNRMDVEVEGTVDVTRLAAAFRGRYEAVVGAGSAPAGAPVEVVAVSVEALLPARVDEPPGRAAGPGTPVRHKRATFGGHQSDCPVYAWEALGAGQSVAGPAFVETATTTAVVYPGQRAVVGGNGDLSLILES